MEKSWYKSKAIWGGLFVSLGAILTGFGQFLNGTIDLGTLFTQIGPQFGIGLGIIGLRTAQK